MKRMALLLTFMCFSANVLAQVPNDPQFPHDYVALTASGGSGVTSVGLTAPGFLSVGGSPVTSSGTLALTFSGTAIPAINGGTAQTAYALGDVLYSSATNTLSRLAGNTTSTKLFLTQTGTGSVSAAPGWGALVAGDIPGTLNTTTAPSFTVSPNTGSFSFASSTQLLAPANGTLQVATATGTFGTLLLGAAGSATGVQLVSSNGVLAFSTGSGGGLILHNSVYETSNSQGFANQNAPTYAYGFADATHTTIYTAGTSALAFDSTQNAVFGGNISGPGNLIIGSALNAISLFQGPARLEGGVGAGTTGILAFPSATTGTVAFSQATGTLVAAGFSFNGNISLANGTWLGDTANGTHQITTSSGGFGTLLLGQAGATTGVQLVSSSQELKIQNGAGTAIDVTAASFTLGSSRIVASSSNPGLPQGSIAFPAAGTGTMALYPATGTLTGPGFSLAGSISGGSHQVVSKTGAYTLVATTNSAAGDSDKTFTNAGAVASVPFALFACTSSTLGQHARFMDVNSSAGVGFTVTSNGADTIIIGGVTGTTKTVITTTLDGSTLELECAVAGTWFPVAAVGTFASN